MVIADNQLETPQTSRLERAEQILVGRLTLGVRNLHPEDLPEAVVAHCRDDQYSLAYHPPIYPYLLVAGIYKQVRVSLGLKLSVPPRLKLRVEAAGQLTDETLGKGGAAQCFGDLRNLAGRDALHVHLHKRQNERLLVSLVAGEEAGGEGTFPILRH